MHEKYINIKRIAVPIITVIMIASQLFGCAAVSQDEALDIMQNNTQVEIEVPELSGKQDETSVEQLAWIPLYDLTTYQDTLRTPMEVAINTGYYEDATIKDGLIYHNSSSMVDVVKNNTLKLLLQRGYRFRDSINREETIQALAEAASNTYIDLADADTDTKFYMAINGYFNLLPDRDDKHCEFNSTLTRAEFMAMLMRAETPVDDTLQLNKDFTSAVGVTEYNLYAQEVVEDAYINTSDKSLNSKTYNDNITRAEALYLLMNHYYKDDLSRINLESMKLPVGYLGDELMEVDLESIITGLEDVKNGGDIATAQGYTGKDNAKAYELQYATNNPDTGLSTELYKAIVLANYLGVIDSETRWDEVLTKSEGIEFIVKTLETLGKDEEQSSSDTTSTDNGDSTTDKQLSPGNQDGYIDEVTGLELTSDGRLFYDPVTGVKQIDEGFDKSGLTYEEDAADGFVGFTLHYREDNTTYLVYHVDGSIYEAGDTLPDGTIYGGTTMEDYKLALRKELGRQ